MNFKYFALKLVCFALAFVLVIPCAACTAEHGTLPTETAPPDADKEGLTTSAKEYKEIIFYNGADILTFAGSFMPLAYGLSADVKFKDAIESEEYEDFRFAVYMAIVLIEKDANGYYYPEQSEAIEYFRGLGVEITPSDPETAKKYGAATNELYEAVLSREDIYTIAEAFDEAKANSENKYGCMLFWRAK